MSNRQKEIEKEAIKQCTFKVKGIDRYVDTIDNTQYKGFIAGAQWADKTMIEKATEWLEYNLCYYDENYRGIDSGDSLIEDFKQAMMEE